MTTCGRAVRTARVSASASKTSTIAGAPPAAAMRFARSGERVVPVTSWPALTSSGRRRRPIAPEAPARKMRMRIAFRLSAARAAAVFTSQPEARLRRAPEALQRRDDFFTPRLRLLALLALAVDHLLGRARKKIGVRQLGVDAGDVGPDLGHLLLEPRPLAGKIDDACQRQRP